MTNGSAGIQLAAGSVGLGLNSGNGILTLTSSQVVVGTQSDEFGDTPPSPGTDTSFFVSGSLASKGTAVRGAATFGGDVVTSGTLTAESGLSGSLTQLSDGTSYLIAGANITITSASNGAITIVGAAAGGGATSGTFNEPAAGAMATTASVSFAGGLGFNHLVEDIGTDTFFFVSGTIGSKNTAVEGTSVFGGDIVSSGTLTAESGLSGSLTQLSDGTSYLIAGSNVTVTSASNGAITIASTATGGATSGTFNEPAAGAMATTASVSFAGGLGFNHLVEDIGTDAFFFVSGTIGSKDSATAGVAVFGGDIAMSGTLTAETGLSGSLTQLSDGTSYLIAGSNVTITSASNGAVTVASTGGGAGATYWASSVPDSIYATGSIMMAGSSGFVEPGDVGTDVYNYISGTVDGKDGAVPGVTVFNGDTVMSGAIYGGRSSQLAANYLNLLADLVEVHGADSGDTGTDVNFLVSGTINSAGSAVRGTAAFTGDVVVSGTLSTLNGIVGGSHYGGIYNFDNAAAQTLGVGDAEVVDWNNIGGLAMSGSSGITISPSTNKMTVTAAGTYSINFSLTFNGSANSEYRFYVKVNSANQDHITVDRLLNSTGDITSATSMGISVLAENDVVELWVEAGTTTVTIRNSSFMLHQIA